MLKNLSKFNLLNLIKRYTSRQVKQLDLFDSSEYMSGDYHELVWLDQQEKKGNLKYLVEPLVILLLILGYCFGMAMMQNRDQKSQNKALSEEIARLKLPANYTCLHTVNNIIHQYPGCKVVAGKYIRVNQP